MSPKLLSKACGPGSGGPVSPLQSPVSIRLLVALVPLGRPLGSLRGEALGLDPLSLLSGHPPGLRHFHVPQ